MKFNSIGSILSRCGIFGFLIALIIIFSITNENFRKPANFTNILQQSAPIALAAVGMTIVIISGAFDLSVGSTMALTACVMVSLIDKIGFYPALVIALFLGALLGMTNGIIITKLKVNPFIATLATLWIYRAIAYIYTNNKPLHSMNETFVALTDNLFCIPLIMIICFVLAFIILYFTPFGRFVFALGSNRNAALLSGIKVDKVTIVIFMLVGIFAAVAGVAMSARLWSARADMAMGYELMIIAAVVLGGTSLKGGTGTLFGTFAAALIFAVIYNAMDMFMLPSFWQKIALGGMLLLALSLDALRKKHYI